MQKYRTLFTHDRQTVERSQKVIVFEKANKDRFVVKTFSSSPISPEYKRIKNEANVFSIWYKFQNANDPIHLPKVDSVKIGHNSITLTREFVVGKSIESLSEKIQIKVIKSALEGIQILSSRMSKTDTEKFPHKRPMVIPIEFVAYILICLFRNPLNVQNIYRAFVIFFSHLNVQSFVKPDYVLSHRDLHSGNIILNNKSIYIIDPAVGLMAEPETDLAIVARLYFNRLPTTDLISLVKSRVKSISGLNQFIRLAMFYSIQLLAIQKKDNFYSQSESFISEFPNVFLPALEGVHERK